MFQLQIADTDVTGGSLAVSWCVDHELLNQLVKLNCKDLQVVICVSPADNYSNNKEYRKVVPLKDLMTFIEFRCSGKNNIWGFISFSSKNTVKNYYLGKCDSGYINDILYSDGSNYHDYIKNENKVFSEPLTVDVPDGVFAEEPADWEKIWVNHFFRNKVVDQCDFRKRRLFAYFLQPVILILNFLLRLFIITFATLTLCRNTSLKYLFHPLMYSINDTFDVFEKGTYVWNSDSRDSDTDIPNVDYFLSKTWKAFLMPLIWLPILICSIFSLWPVVIVIVGILLLISLIFMSVSFAKHASYNFGFLGRVIFWLPNKFINYFLMPKELWYLDKNEINLIICSEDKKVLSYKDIPNNRKTINLRIQNIKSKICKPFSL